MNRTFDILPYLALICLSLAVLSGCKKVDVPSDDLSQGLVPSGTTITFETDDPASKAIINSKEDLEQVGNSFRVFSWFEGTTSGSMFREDEETDGIPVTYTAATANTPAAWTYTPLRYWMSGTYNFAAVYPSSVAATYQPATQNGTPILSIPSFDITSQEDLMYAVKNGIDGSTANNNNPVSLQFSHMLTLVKINLTQNMDKDKGDPENDYLIKKVTISGVKKEGIYENGWSYDAATASFTRVYEEPQKLKRPINGDLTNLLPLTPWIDGLLLFPQEISSEAIQVKVECLYRLAGTTGDKDADREFIGYIPASVDAWQPGKRITYTMTISSPINITISAPKIQPWDESATQGDMVIM